MTVQFQPKSRLMISLFTLLYEFIHQKNEVELFMIVLRYGIGLN